MFEEAGFYREYFVGSKYIGKVNCERDREVIGYEGIQTIILENDVICHNKKKIKKGTQVRTLLYPLCNKLIK